VALAIVLILPPETGCLLLLGECGAGVAEGVREGISGEASDRGLLRPEEMGVRLTEGMMMDPGASVSALVFHHPDCVYFTASE